MEHDKSWVAVQRIIKIHVVKKPDLWRGETRTKKIGKELDYRSDWPPYWGLVDSERV